MRRLGMCVVLLGLAALLVGTVGAPGTGDTAPAAAVTGPDQRLAVQRLLGWAAVVGLVALATLASGLGDLMMSYGHVHAPGPPQTPERETAAMIEAEVNEGGPPSPMPCDTPAKTSACAEVHHSMSETPLTIETCPAPDRILHLPLGKTIETATSAMLLKSDGLELIRLVVPAGKEIPPHRAPGEITVQCIEGLVAFEHDGHVIELRPGDLLHLCPQESHALKGLVDSSVLVTRLRPRATEMPETFPSR